LRKAKAHPQPGGKGGGKNGSSPTGSAEGFPTIRVKKEASLGKEAFCLDREGRETPTRTRVSSTGEEEEGICHQRSEKRSRFLAAKFKARISSKKGILRQRKGRGI